MRDPELIFVQRISRLEKAFIDVLNEKVFLPQSYINYFVLAEWNLKQEQLYIYFKKEQKSKMIKKLSFNINPKSKERVSHFI